MSNENLDEDQDWPDDEEGQSYRRADEIGPSELREALGKLHLFDDDPYLRMQAFNLALVDQFIMQIEYAVLEKLNQEERTPAPEAAFLSAQSQMWIFAAYEILRTWRERAKDMVKWAENGGLNLKLEALEKDIGFEHTGRKIRAGQIRCVLADPSLIPKVKDDVRRTHILFAQIEAIRVSLAKHAVRGKEKSVALMPGYGRINEWCGSLEYEMESGTCSVGQISRRDIADGLRSLTDREPPPTDEDLERFDVFMRGPPDNPFQN